MRSIKICKIYGLGIKIDWTIFILFGLLIFSFGSLQVKHFDNESLVYVSFISITFALLFILSIFLHEVGHVVAGKWFGIKFSSIKLFILGGMATMEDYPDDPKKEAIIAFAGPVTSFLIGVVCLVAIYALANIGIATLPGPMFLMLSSLAYINFILALFNLIPAFPTDGGRILRSAMWYWKGDFLKATTIAVKVSRGFSHGLIISGILMIVGVNIPVFGTGIGGIWIIFIGALLGSMAKQELKSAQRLAEIDWV